MAVRYVKLVNSLESAPEMAKLVSKTKQGNLQLARIRQVFHQTSPVVVTLFYRNESGQEVYLDKSKHELVFFAPDGGWNQETLYYVTFLQPSESNTVERGIRDTLDSLQRSFRSLQQDLDEKLQRSYRDLDEKLQRSYPDLDEKLTRALNRSPLTPSQMSSSGPQLYDAERNTGFLGIQEMPCPSDILPIKIEKDYTPNLNLYEDLKEKWRDLRKQHGPKIDENKAQHPIFADLLKALNQDTYDVVHDKSYFDNQQRPDFAFNLKDKPHHPLHCGFVVELQTDLRIDSEHKARVIQYNQLILQSNPLREFILSIVTNLDDAVFIESKGDRAFIRHFEYLPVNFWTDGVIRLNHMIHKTSVTGLFSVHPDVHFTIPSDTTGQEYYLSNYISRGHTASVFKFQRYDKPNQQFHSSDLVAKVFREDRYYDEEYKIVNELRQRVNNTPVKHLLRMVHADQSMKTIVYQPYGEPILKLTQDRVNQMFDCLEKLQRYGVIHRDLSPNHFLKRIVDGRENVFVIDFGAAFLFPPENPAKDLNAWDNNQAELTNYRGSIQFAASDILQNLIAIGSRRTEYKPRRRHDVESLLRSMMFIYHELTFPQAFSRGTPERIVQATMEFWKIVDDSVDGQMKGFWRNALLIARTKEPATFTIENLRNHFNNLQFNYISNETLHAKFDESFNARTSME